MKKFGKLAVLAAMVLALACFVSCKDDDDGGNNYGNVVATYVCAEPQGSEGAYSFTLRFYDSGKFYATYKDADCSGEISTGSYTGDPANDGDIVFKVEDYVDYMYVLLGTPQSSWKWEGKTIADQTVTITSGKGTFNIWDSGAKEFTRQE